MYDPNYLSVAPLGNGKKLVTVFDRKANCNKSFQVDSEKADEFVTNRAAAGEKKLKQNIIASGISLIGSTLTGAMIKCGGSRIEGGVFGLIAGCFISILIALCNGTSDSVQSKLTEQFIKENS